MKCNYFRTGRRFNIAPRYWCHRQPPIPRGRVAKCGMTISEGTADSRNFRIQLFDGFARLVPSRSVSPPLVPPILSGDGIAGTAGADGPPGNEIKTRIKKRWKRIWTRLTEDS